jgi:hypothetical protein
MSTLLDETRRARAAAKRRRKAIHIRAHSASTVPEDARVAARWRSAVLEWAKTWKKNPGWFPMPSGLRRRADLSLLIFLMEMAGNAQADGSLAGKRDWWSVEQLAAKGDVSPKTAADTLEWMQEIGLMSKATGAWNVERAGRGTDERRLILPEALPQPVSSALRSGKPRQRGSKAQQSSSAFRSDQTVTTGGPDSNNRGSRPQSSGVQTVTPRSSVAGHVVPVIPVQPLISGIDSPAPDAAVPETEHRSLLGKAEDDTPCLPSNFGSLSPKQQQAAYAELDARSHL